jgi:hypothetical protein
LRKLFLTSFLSILSLALAATTVEAAPKKKSAEKAKPKAEEAMTSSGDKAQWSLALMAGLAAPTGDFAADPGGQSAGFQGDLVVEMGWKDFALNLDTSFAILPNQPEVSNLSAMRVAGTSLNAKWNFSPGDTAFYLLAGFGLDTQSFTATTGSGDVTLSSTDFALRTGLGASFGMGGNSAIVLEALFHSILAEPAASMFPIRAGYRIGL